MTHLRQTLRTATDLVDAGLAPAHAEADVARVAARYAVAVTPAMAELIDAKDSADPIARQFVPDVRELERAPEERSDPIGDHVKSPVKGIVHRYADRVLLKIVGVCPVYCRFCFRREMVGPAAEANLTAEEIDAALAYIRAHPEVWEVILTGGDPFVMSPRRVQEITQALASIDHVKIVRWHTRVPVVAPERVTADLVGALGAARKTVYVALHSNHPRELTAAARAAIARLVDAGIPVVSQTVLLRGVNDSVETLEALMRAFVEARVKPYYLHHGDLAPGTAHFRTTVAEGQALMHALRQRVSGLAMPTYMLDIPGGHGKVPVGPVYLDGETVVDPRGGPHRTDGACVL
ncbi:lysine-2,3-aminomutase-like protein [Hyphomicrobium sp.]|uniref:lysine-2,3-aminomutase-like protein n=1 Tax=Hyphomicrobium sp. TaxID=82 RepID=UPI0025B7D43F|nr:lysine-2,3-aminomutase-like protein [Hyphomicrobium sp.]MCC7252476.1 lysine-2,3-aminomutase-like protein [Hyphomicrobium sp.]